MIFIPGISAVARKKIGGAASHWSANGATLDSLDSYLKIVLNMNGADDGTTFTDSTGLHTWSVSGDAKTKTGQKKEGTASLYTPGNSSDDGISTASSADFQVGTGDYFICFWVRYNSSLHEYQDVFCFNTYSSGYMYQFKTTSGGSAHQFYANGNGVYTSGNTDTLTVETWYMITITRNSGVTKIYRDATEKSSVSDTNNISATGNFTIGVDPSLTSNMFQGYLDAFIMGKGKGLSPTEVTALYNSGTGAFWSP